MEDCKHMKEDGSTSLIFACKKWTGVTPQKTTGICFLCKKHILMTMKEYGELFKENGGV